MRALEPWHLIVLVVVIAVLFGSRRLPDAARGLGRSMRIFKSEMQQMKDDTPPATKRPAPTGPLEGKVVDEAHTSDGQRTPDGRTEHRTDSRTGSTEARHDV